jgi:polyisoprenoid-binding protein YceI
MFGTGKVSGTFALRAGQVYVAELPDASTVDAEIDTASLNTGNSIRDKIVAKPNLLDSAKYPVMTFKSSGVWKDGEQWVLAGDLEVRGGKAPVEFRVTEARASGNTLVISATGDIDRYAHGITSGKGMIARRLRIELQAVATRDAA